VVKAVSKAAGAPPLLAERGAIATDTRERCGAAGDPRLLRVVLRKLLENAILYSPQGGAIDVVLRPIVARPVVGDESAKDEAAIAPRREMLELAVCDCGFGIPDEHLRAHRRDARGRDLGRKRRRRRQCVLCGPNAGKRRRARRSAGMSAGMIESWCVRGARRERERRCENRGSRWVCRWVLLFSVTGST
jgi:hypothetical protein